MKTLTGIAVVLMVIAGLAAGCTRDDDTDDQDGCVMYGFTAAVAKPTSKSRTPARKPSTSSTGKAPRASVSPGHRVDIDLDLDDC